MNTYFEPGIPFKYLNLHILFNYTVAYCYMYLNVTCYANLISEVIASPQKSVQVCLRFDTYTEIDHLFHDDYLTSTPPYNQIKQTQNSTLLKKTLLIEKKK